MHYHGRVIVSLPGKGPDLTAIEKAVIQHPMTLGIIIFDCNFENKEQLRQLISNIQRAGNEGGKIDIPIFTDQEGGNIQMLRRGDFKPIPSAKAIGEVYMINKEVGLRFAQHYGKILASDLMEVGVIPLGPVLDLDQGNPVISLNDRSFAENPESLINIASSFIKGMEEAGIPATAKHWPGHGMPIGDSHHQEVGDERTLDEIPDIKVYKALSPLLKAVMFAHITFPNVDTSPVVSSDKWMSILRDQVGFKGVTLSDCLAMKGAGKASNVSKITEALKRLDVALLCHLDPADYLHVLDTISTKPSEETVLRIEDWVKSTAGKRAEIERDYAPSISSASLFS